MRVSLRLCWGYYPSNLQGPRPDRLNRPLRLNEGDRIETLYTG